MDLDEFRTILSNSGVNVWEIIDAAISVASSDYGKELKDRRDLIVERLYAATSRCENCDVDGRRRLQVEEKHKFSIEMGENQKQGSPFSTPGTVHGTDEVEDGEEDGGGGGEDERVRDLFGDLFDDDEETKILRIKEQIEDPDQSEDSLVELLQGLADMDITFKALKETDIGRHVNHLRKHPSNEVRRLVKQLVRKWKDLVDEWVKLKETDEHASSTLLADGDSPLQSVPPRNAQNGHHQVPDFAYSPNPHNGSSGSDKNYSEPEPKPKPKPIPRRDAPAKQSHSLPISASAPPIVKREQKESNIDERLASARKRLHENYQEAQNGFYFLTSSCRKVLCETSTPHGVLTWCHRYNSCSATCTCNGPMWPNMNELTTPRRHGDGAVWGCIVPSDSSRSFGNLTVHISSPPFSIRAVHC